MKALKTFVAQDVTQLSFNKGDVITLTTGSDIVSQPEWLHGAVHGKIGKFPADLVVNVTLHKLSRSHTSFDSLVSRLFSLYSYV